MKDPLEKLGWEKKGNVYTKCINHDNPCFATLRGTEVEIETCYYSSSYLSKKEIIALAEVLKGAER